MLRDLAHGSRWLAGWWLPWGTLATLLLAVSPVGSPRAADEGPVQEARTLLATYHEDVTRLERARQLLEAATRRDPEPDALVLLSRVWFLIGDVVARSDTERLRAFDQGREAGRAAVEAAPRNAEAHLWYAINTGRWAQTKGLFRAALLVSKVREEAELVLRLDSDSVEGHALVGSLAAEMPRALGGDARRAEEHFWRALAIDPHRAGVRVELARLYAATGRYADARREINLALEDRAPSDLPYWRLKAEPQARALLESIKGR
jgi:tetratricopeptide (TPR) repeat protein